MFNKVFTKILYFKISQSNRAPKECKKNEVFFSFSHLKMSDDGSILSTILLMN